MKSERFKSERYEVVYEYMNIYGEWQTAHDDNIGAGYTLREAKRVKFQIAENNGVQFVEIKRM